MLCVCGDHCRLGLGAGLVLFASRPVVRTMLLLFVFLRAMGCTLGYPIPWGGGGGALPHWDW